MNLDALINRYPSAVLVLADGSIFSGQSIGASGTTVGEVVFNTAMTGYQEILTDPSYCQQIVTLTCPHIGNVGINPLDPESDHVHAAGLVVRDLSLISSNWRSTESLPDYLTRHNIVAISGIDTRRLTRLLRDKGAQNGCIVTNTTDSAEALRQAQQFPGLIGKDLAKLVSTKQVVSWHEGTLDLFEGKFFAARLPEFHVVAYDFGVKQQILRLLVDRGCKVTLVPAETPAETVLAYQPDGVLLSNGPGDPAACGYAIENIKALLQKDIPMLGICLGFQLLALACGANTLKMKFGHHGANHPVQNLQTKLVAITSQNHGFAVDDASLPSSLQITHRSLFDGTLQGFTHKTKPVVAFQGHPEASPGPHELTDIFDQFICLMRSPVSVLGVR